MLVDLKNKHPKKLVNVVRNIALTVIFFTTMIITIFQIYHEFDEFSIRADKLELEYLTSQKNLIKQEVINVTDYIERRRWEHQQLIKEKVKTRVYEAHAIATNLYNKFKNKLSEKDVKNLIIEALRPLRFFDGQGYYYIHSLEGVCQLNALRPNIEGENRFSYKNIQGRYLVRELVDLIKKSGEDFLEYKFPSFKDKKTENSKVAFVKEFKPFGWLIGSGNYLNSVEKEIQTELLAYIEQVKFGNNSYIFVVNYQGVVLVNSSQKKLVGTNIWNLEDPNGVKVIQEERRAVENPDGDFIYYTWNKPSTSTTSPKISFIKGIKDWQWMIGTGLYVDDAHLVIEQQKSKLKDDLFNLSILIILIGSFIGFIVIYVLNRFSNKISRELDLFLEFFKNMSVKAEKINVNAVQYAELRDLAISANRMLDKQNEIESNRSKAELSLRVSEKNLQEAQKIMHFGSWEYNVVTEDLYWSDEVYRILGLDPDKTIPSYKLFMGSTHPDDRELVDTTYKNSVANRKPYDIEHRIKLPDGKVKRVREHIEMVYDVNGKTVRSTGTIQDVTELREKEEMLKRSQKMDALGKLTGGIAHDYNNMLGVIIGYSELLLENPDGTPQSIKYATQIHDAGERARALTTKLMAFSRYTTSYSETVDINAELIEQQQLLEKTLTARIKLKLSLTQDIWKINLDKGDLNDAIINMIINASHAIDGNGNVTITTSNLTINTQESNVLDLDEGDYVALSISDTGHGMDIQTIAKIFDPFFSTKGELGTGLGLSQVYGFVKRSGGNIGVESELDMGTEFTLYFPRYHSINLEVDKYAEHFSVGSGNENILVVDDEVSLSEMAKEILSSHGYHVFVATSAQQALMLLEIEKIDLIFSDVIMPGMNGYELADIVSKKYPHIQIQLTSGFNDMINMKNDLDISAVDVLQKPYSSNNLLIRIRELLDRKSH